MTKEEVLQHDKKFRYMLLSRMQSDCEYYLNYGNRNPKRLWAGDDSWLYLPLRFPLKAVRLNLPFPAVWSMAMMGQ